IEVENKTCTNYTTNDYLGIGQIAFDKDDFERFMRKYIYHLSSSRLIRGSSTAYEEIETMIAGWNGYSASTILNRGYYAKL
ncbi:8-amino-7-oxononanoate synthase, partial [Staphylococcus aureus]|nr:8-amino-7-oxononanoate synthase [Staphylococcus aureus]